MHPQIANIIMQMPESKMRLASELRDVILANPGMKEIIKWTRITFACGQNDVAFICSCPGKPYIELGFFKAVYLSDPKKLFEGKGKELRRIKIHSTDTIPVKHIEDWITEANQIDLLK